MDFPSPTIGSCSRGSRIPLKIIKKILVLRSKLISDRTWRSCLCWLRFSSMPRCFRRGGCLRSTADNLRLWSIEVSTCQLSYLSLLPFRKEKSDWLWQPWKSKSSCRGLQCYDILNRWVEKSQGCSMFRWESPRISLGGWIANMYCLIFQWFIVVKWTF